jgi:predicted secreted protein
MDNKHYLSVPVNHTFRIQLPENPTTGYQWTMQSTKGITLLESQYVPDTHSMLGSGGMMTWTLLNHSTDPQQLVFRYERPWEHSDSDTQDLSATVTYYIV